MNNKLFVKRLGISLLWVLGAITLSIGFGCLCFVFGSENVIHTMYAIGLTACALVLAFSYVYSLGKRWYNWLTVKDQQL